MRPRISIRGSVRPSVLRSVLPSVRPSVLPSVRNAFFFLNPRTRLFSAAEMDEIELVVMKGDEGVGTHLALVTRGEKGWQGEGRWWRGVTRVWGRIWRLATKLVKKYTNGELHGVIHDFIPAKIKEILLTKWFFYSPLKFSFENHRL